MSRIWQFLREVKTEMFKVVWPSRSDTMKMTMVVILFSLAVALFLGAADYGFSRLLSFILSRWFMLPTGHLAAGYLVTKFTIQTLIPAFPQANQPIFWAVGILSSVVTDLDMFYLFYKVGKAISSTAQTNHRVFISHAPLIYLLVSVLGLTLGLILKNSNLQVLAILYFTGVTTHFILDSLRFGIMWLWPFKKRLYAFTGAGVETRPQSEKFLEYWTQFIKIYAKTPIFYLESILVLLAIYIILI